MTIGIIYCESLKNEIQMLSGKYREISHLEVLPWELHLDPDRLLAEVDRQIRLLQEHVGVIVLGYGRCQTMDRLESDYKVPVLRPEAEDCIGILLGQERYEEELRQCPGTWFLSPGWTRLGTDFVFSELQLDRIGHKEINTLQFARRMLDGFSRALYIKLDSCFQQESLDRKAQQIATDLGLRLEKTSGSCSALENMVERALDFLQNQHSGHT